MTKAVLVMDMPESCKKCNLSYMIPLGTRLICHATEMPRVIRTTHDKPDWCPLRELPEKKETLTTIECHSNGRWTEGMKAGWNACLDRILGEPPGKGSSQQEGESCWLSYEKESM